jgi:hypothetical protein
VFSFVSVKILGNFLIDRRYRIIFALFQAFRKVSQEVAEMFCPSASTRASVLGVAARLTVLLLVFGFAECAAGMCSYMHVHFCNIVL